MLNGSNPQYSPHSSSHSGCPHICYHNHSHKKSQLQNAQQGLRFHRQLSHNNAISIITPPPSSGLINQVHIFNKRQTISIVFFWGLGLGPDLDSIPITQTKDPKKTSAKPKTKKMKKPKSQGVGETKIFYINPI